MGLYIQKTLIEAFQWFKNGDHPLDGDEVFTKGEFKGEKYEGKVVRYYRNPDENSSQVCPHCGNTLHVHGWIDNETADGIKVCPGDFIVTIGANKYTAVKQNYFLTNYARI